jgi:prepilin-type N-terminal cleavage/methylation domain-containing protein
VKKYTSGFTLIELSIVVAITSLIIVGTFEIQRQSYNQRINKITNDHLSEIEVAIKNFVNENGYLPCVAPSNLRPDAVGFGVSVNCASAAAPAGVTSVNSAGGKTIFIGSVPVRSLNLPDETMMDGFNRRYTMAITASLGVPNSYDVNIGAIDVIDSGGNSLLPKKDAAYIVISHGKDTAGARGMSGAIPLACAAAGLDVENCNNDAKFRRTTLYSEAVGANHFDDKVEYKTKGQISASGITRAYIDKMDCNPPVVGGVVPADVAGTYLGTNLLGERCVTALAYDQELHLKGTPADPRLSVKLYDHDVVAQGNGRLIVKATIPVRYMIYNRSGGYWDDTFMAALYINDQLVTITDLINPFGTHSAPAMGSNGGSGLLMASYPGIIKGQNYKIEIYAFTMYRTRTSAGTPAILDSSNSSPVLLGHIKVSDHSVEGVVEIMESSI